MRARSTGSCMQGVVRGGARVCTPLSSDPAERPPAPPSSLSQGACTRPSCTRPPLAAYAAWEGGLAAGASLRRAWAAMLCRPGGLARCALWAGSAGGCISCHEPSCRTRLCKEAALSCDPMLQGVLQGVRQLVSACRQTAEAVANAAAIWGGMPLCAKSHSKGGPAGLSPPWCSLQPLLLSFEFGPQTQQAAASRLRLRTSSALCLQLLFSLQSSQRDTGLAKA